MKQETKTNVVETMARRVALDQAIAKMSDKYSASAQEYGQQLAKTKLEKTQVRKLETLAYTTNKVSDVTDWLKLHVGRDDKWSQEGLGRELLGILEGLYKEAREITGKIRETYPLTYDDSDLERQVHLRLIREYLKHLAAHFEYARAMQGKKR